MDSSKSRLLVIANRLPVTMKKIGGGRYEYQMSSGGLISGLSALSKQTQFQWFGWPGFEIPEEDVENVQKTLECEYNAVPVFLESKLADKHYNGFSNSVLWPLLHYYPDKMSFDESFGVAYEKVNQLFADAVATHIQDNDLIWVHDYHLMLLPSKLREATKGKKNIRIGFFLHTAFPSRDFFTILPKRDELLKGLLSCNLVGFHTAEYERHFLDSCSSIVRKCEVTDHSVKYDNREIITGAYPIGIDPEEFREGFREPEVQQLIQRLKKRHEDVKVIVGVDRMDYIKGIPQKLHAFDAFLTNHPEWKEKTILIQVAIPTRPDVEEYQRLRNEVNGLVGDIEGRHGSMSYAPIHFMYKSVSKSELIALYGISDVCLVSSTRDGMNLVSYEYVASQHDNHGVLVISKYTGAAEILSDGALVVNPWDADEFSETIQKALTMTDKERKEKYDTAIKYIDEHTCFYWGRTFLQKLEQ